MKKTSKKITVLSLATTLLLLTGCANKGTLRQSTEIEKDNESTKIGSEIESSLISDTNGNVERVPIPTVRDTFEKEIAVLKSRQFDNIYFADLKSYSFPNVSEITTYKVTKHELNTGLSPEHFFENYVAYCNYLEPGKYTRDEIAEICEIQGNFEGRLNYNELTARNKNGDLIIGYISILTPDLYLDYFGSSAPSWYNSNQMKKLLGVESERDPTRYGVIDSETRPVVLFTENVNSADVYHLLDGDISIADAAKKTNAFLADMAKQCDDGEYQREVCAVNVVDIGEGNYGFEFLITDVVDGIKYAYADSRGGIGLGIHYTYSEGSPAAGSMDKLEMLRSDKPASFHTTGGWKGRTPVETCDSIVPLNNAAENVANLLSGKMNFNAKSVTLVYDIKGGTDDLVPCWRFILDNTAKQEQSYHVYVNALTGEARVKCIQNVDYRYEYD